MYAITSILKYSASQIYSQFKIYLIFFLTNVKYLFAYKNQDVSTTEYRIGI